MCHIKRGCMKVNSLLLLDLRKKGIPSVDGMQIRKV